MNDTDEKGWSHIHHCAYRGYVKSLERFVEGDPESLELQTTDDQANTPFLLAVASGNQDMVACLINLGAKVDAINSQNHGAVEICALKHHISLLRYFLSLALDKLPVWKNLLKMLGSDMEEDAVAAGTCLKTLTDPTDGVINSDWEPVYSHGIVPVISKVVKSAITDDCKVPAIQCLLNMLERPEVQEQVVSSGGLPAFIKLLKSNNNFVVQLSATVVKELTKNREYSEMAVQNSAIQSLQRVLQFVNDPEVLVPSVEAVTNIASSGSKMAATIGSTAGCIGAIVSVFNSANTPNLLLALTNAVAALAGSRENQTALANEGVTQHIFNVILTQCLIGNIGTPAQTATKQSNVP
ncbi:hypothetical protein C0Q70_19251 [Pomacea canaliculata]|uniref:Uncharacterized protein n=1 Tax=Pomacea canaliculata TaxID=400727 RepID=A0A2T7NIV3_POMCA|nr:hypothetical protein C0Q70_19251 [Pomacea canaliculata]